MNIFEHVARDVYEDEEDRLFHAINMLGCNPGEICVWDERDEE